MPGIYRPRHPERTVLYRVLFHHFDWFDADVIGLRIYRAATANPADSISYE